MVTVAAADVSLGKPAGWPSFGWDNEYGQRTLHIRQFQASTCLVRAAPPPACLTAMHKLRIVT
jgi:hypothetical protein